MRKIVMLLIAIIVMVSCGPSSKELALQHKPEYDKAIERAASTTLTTDQHVKEALLSDIPSIVKAHLAQIPVGDPNYHVVASHLDNLELIAKEDGRDYARGSNDDMLFWYLLWSGSRTSTSPYYGRPASSGWIPLTTSEYRSTYSSHITETTPSYSKSYSSPYRQSSGGFRPSTGGGSGSSSSGGYKPSSGGGYKPSSGGFRSSGGGRR